MSNIPDFPKGYCCGCGRRRVLSFWKPHTSKPGRLKLLGKECPCGCRVGSKDRFQHTVKRKAFKRPVKNWRRGCDLARAAKRCAEPVELEFAVTTSPFVVRHQWMLMFDNWN